MNDKLAKKLRRYAKTIAAAFGPEKRDKGFKVVYKRLKKNQRLRDKQRG